MTKKERRTIIKAIRFFLDEDPDKWVDGIDELYLLAFGRKWSESRQTTGQTINVTDLFLRSCSENDPFGNRMKEIIKTASARAKG